MEQSMIALAAIGVLGIACQWLAWWAKLPAILFLLLTGIAVGPVLGWLDPDRLFGDLLFPMVSLAVSVILFEGSLTLRFKDIQGQERVVRDLVGIGLLVTWAVTALAARFFTGFEWEIAILIGALLVVTGPTVVVPMLRTVRPNARVAEVLRWEGIVIDPIGALLAVLVYEFLIARAGEGALLHTMLTFATTIAVGAATGAIVGQLLGMLLRAHWLPDYLRNVTTLVAVGGAFAASNAIESESGLLTVTVMGIWLANMKDVPLDEVLDFKESLSILLISVLFIVLAARLSFDDLAVLGYGAVGVFLAIQFVARPLKVLLATRATKFKWQEKALIAWIGPRGVVAAAVSAIFVPKLEALGFEQAPLLVPLTFVVIIGTVVLQSATAGWLARVLGVAEPEPKGVLVVGANTVARAIGKAMQEEGFRVVMADTVWDNVSAARMQGLKAHFVNPVSEQADRRLDLVGVGRLLALSPRSELNSLAVLRYRAEFGRGRVYRLASPARGAAPGSREADAGEGRVLFGNDVTYDVLAGRLHTGGRLRGTVLREEFDWDDFRARYPEAMPIFGLNRAGRLRFVVVGEKFAPEEGWTVWAIHPPEPEGKAGRNGKD